MRRGTLRQDQVFTAKFQAEVRFGEVNRGKLGVMSENQANPGGEGRTEDQNFTAPTPAGADRVMPTPETLEAQQAAEARTLTARPRPQCPANSGCPQTPPAAQLRQPRRPQAPRRHRGHGAAEATGAPGYDPALGWGRPGAAQTQPLPPVGQTYPRRDRPTRLVISASCRWHLPAAAVPRLVHPGSAHGRPDLSGHRPAGCRSAAGWWPGVAALAIALTAGGVGGFVGYALHPDGSPLQIPGTTGNGNAAPVIDRSSLASIAAALQPAIVDITSSAG